MHQVHKNGPFARRYKKDAFRDLLDGLGNLSSQMTDLYIDLGRKILSGSGNVALSTFLAHSQMFIYIIDTTNLNQNAFTILRMAG